MKITSINDGFLKIKLAKLCAWLGDGEMSVVQPLG